MNHARPKKDTTYVLSDPHPWNCNTKPHRQVLGAASADMRMFPLQSAEEVNSFPLTKWKIREPSEELALSREDGVTEGDIGVVIVPAVAFDSRCNRLGHGRGHYGGLLGWRRHSQGVARVLCV